MDYRSRQLPFDPTHNPAVLDTATWDRQSASTSFDRLPDSELESLCRAARTGAALPSTPTFRAQSESLVCHSFEAAFLAGLPDGQEVLVEVLPPGQAPKLGEPLCRRSVGREHEVVCQPADAAVIHQYFQQLNPQKGPQALGATPRLGIGVRMTTSCWPAALRAMQEGGFSANIIQNSVRELNRLETILNAAPAETNYACGFGTIETGYTGSTYEGLWVSGVLAALKYPAVLPYGADADHVQVKRGPEGLARAKKLLESSRYYSFFTIDMADILEYAALDETSAAGAEAMLDGKIGSSVDRQQIVQFYGQKRYIGGCDYRFDKPTLGRLVGKYWDALAVMEEIGQFILELKNGQPFDLEFTMDEHPPEVAAFDCLTSDHETLFVLLELQRRGVPVTHVAPNFGQEKGLDYRCPDGLEGLERRVAAQFAIAEAFGVMLDIHSGDDLTEQPRRVFQRATGGKNHFKISPMPQIIFARVLQDFHPSLFSTWWEDALAYATREAEAGAEFARQCLADFEARDDRSPSPDHQFFHHFSFAFVGRRNAAGQFLHRDQFYELSPEFYAEHEKRLASYLTMLAEQLF